MFLNIKTYSNKNIRVSASHLIAVPGGQFKFAKSLNREDVIITYDFNKQMKLEEKIESILIEPVDGFAGPLTMSGTLLVDGILASSYAVIESQKLAHAVMAPVRWWYTAYGSLNTAMPNNILSNSLQIGKQLNGTHWYPGLLQSFTEQYLDKIIKLH